MSTATAARRLAGQTPLGRLLKSEGRSQTWLSEATGIPYGSLVRIVKGQRLANVMEARSIARVLRRDLDEIFGPEDEPDRQDRATSVAR